MITYLEWLGIVFLTLIVGVLVGIVCYGLVQVIKDSDED